MKMEETEHLKLQNVNNIHATTSQTNNIHDSDTELAEKNHLHFKYLREKSKL